MEIKPIKSKAQFRGSKANKAQDEYQQILTQIISISPLVETFLHHQETTSEIGIVLEALTRSPEELKHRGILRVNVTLPHTLVYEIYRRHVKTRNVNLDKVTLWAKNKLKEYKVFEEKVLLSRRWFEENPQIYNKIIFRDSIKKFIGLLRSWINDTSLHTVLVESWNGSFTVLDLKITYNRRGCFCGRTVLYRDPDTIKPCSVDCKKCISYKDCVYCRYCRSCPLCKNCPKCVRCKNSSKKTICIKNSNKHCDNCRITFYCSREHQREDWSDHKWECQKWDPKKAKLAKKILFQILFVLLAPLSERQPIVWVGGSDPETDKNRGIKPGREVKMFPCSYINKENKTKILKSYYEKLKTCMVAVKSNTPKKLKKSVILNHKEKESKDGTLVNQSQILDEREKRLKKNSTKNGLLSGLSAIPVTVSENEEAYTFDMEKDSKFKCHDYPKM
jgi:hypothetical protein